MGLNLAPEAKLGYGRYTLSRLLGHGAVGAVWLARDEQLGEEVALKVLVPALAHNPAALDDLRRETIKSRKLAHPNIVRTYELFQHENEPAFIVLEFVDGVALNALKERQENKCIRWDYLQRLARQMCAALAHAHDQKIIHRDIKPANLMLNTQGNLKLADFGLAATAANTLGNVTTNMGATGTPCFMSPQQMEGRPPRPADDIYSLGATLYELLVSQPPFHSGDGLPNEGGIVVKVRIVPAKPLDQRQAELGINNPVPHRVAVTILACLAKEPADRPASIKAVAEGLGLTEPPDSRPAPVPTAPAAAVPPVADPKAAPGFHRGLFIGLAVAAVVAVLALLAIKLMAGK